MYDLFCITSGPATPIDLIVVAAATTPSTITLQWKAPTAVYSNSPIKEYVIQYRPAVAGAAFDSVISTRSALPLAAVVFGLASSTKYDFKVCASNAVSETYQVGHRCVSGSASTTGTTTGASAAVRIPTAGGGGWTGSVPSLSAGVAGPTDSDAIKLMWALSGTAAAGYGVRYKASDGPARTEWLAFDTNSADKNFLVQSQSKAKPCSHTNATQS